MRHWRVLCVVWLCITVSAAAQITLPPDAESWAIHPDAVAFRIDRADGPIAIRGVLWDRRSTDLRLIAASGFDKARGREITTAQILRMRTESRQPVAGINADFFITTGPYAGATVGSYIRGGELMRVVQDRPSLMTLEDGSLRIGVMTHEAKITLPGGRTIDLPAINRPVVNGGLVLYTPAWGKQTDLPDDAWQLVLKHGRPITPDDRFVAEVVQPAQQSGATQSIPEDGLVLAAVPAQADAIRALRAGQKITITIKTFPQGRITDAVGGHPILVSKGQIVYEPGRDEPKHPRSAIGFDGTHAIMVVVDGRAPGHSIGMTLPELAALMKSFGCTEAINVDGGGSSVVWARGRILNRTSDGPERANGNSVVLVSNAPIGPPSRVLIDTPDPLVVMQGAKIPLKYRIVDARYNPLDVRENVTVTAGDGVEVVGDTIHARTPGETTLRLQAGDATGTMRVVVADTIASLVAHPSELRLMPGAAERIEITARDAQRRLIQLDPNAVDIAVDPTLATRAGLRLTAGEAGRRGSATIRAYGQQIALPIAVAKPVPLESFDVPAGRFDGYPDIVEGSVEHARDGETTFMKLRWQFEDRDTAQAAYIVFDRPIGEAMALQARVRLDVELPTRVTVRASIVDHNNTRQLITMYDGVLDREWKTIRCDIPAGLPQPVKWQSVYIVATNRLLPRAGTLEIDQLDVWKTE